MKWRINDLVMPEPSRETLRTIARYTRQCPLCNIYERDYESDYLRPLLNETGSGRVTCNACTKVLSYFFVHDLDIGGNICKVWCCKHPQDNREPIRSVISQDPSYMTLSTRWDSLDDTGYVGIVTRKKYICGLCLYTSTKGVDYVERFDVEWYKPFLDMLKRLAGRDFDGMLHGRVQEVDMPWYEAEGLDHEPDLQRIKDKPSNIQDPLKPVYSFTTDGYMKLPYVLTYQQDPSGQYSVRVIELNLVVHADTQEELQVLLVEQMRAWFVTARDKSEPIPLPVGMEMREGELRPVLLTQPTLAIPAQYQRYGQKGKDGDE